MKKSIKVFVFLISIVLINSCINLKILLPEDPGWGIEFFVVSNNLDPENNYDKIAKNIRIKSTDEYIYSIVKILNIEKKVKISWFWYGPDKKIIKKSSDTEVNSNSDFLEYFVIWDSIEKSYYQERKGNWSVIVMANGEFLSYKSFVIY